MRVSSSANSLPPQSSFFSTGKDNRTILWDLRTLQPIADIPNDVDQPSEDAAGELNSSASNVYGAAASAQQKRYHVQWSPLKRGVVCTCSLDRKVQAHSLNGLVTKCGRPPKWLKPNSGVVCGFGGTLVTFGGAADKMVTIQTIVEQPKLQRASAELEDTANSMDSLSFCAQMAAKSILPGEKEIWSFMQVIFDENARTKLREHLGFHPQEIEKAANEFADDGAPAVAGSTGGMSAGAEKAIEKALVVGNFEAAVECCFRTGNLAEALLVASCGSDELFATTKARYFTMEGSKKPFLGVVNAVINDQLESLVEKSTNWRETLAIVSTYAKSENFPALCIQLGDQLEAAGDGRNASLCYMCACSLERAVRYWKVQLDRRGSDDLLALHDFCRKVSIFMRATRTVVLEPEIAAMFDKYAKVLTEQGLLVSAAKYVKTAPELKDRLYRSRESPNCLAAMGNVPPDFPYSMVNVNKAPANAQPKQQGYGQQQQQRSAYGHHQQQQTSYGQHQQQSSYGQQQQQQQQSAYGQQYNGQQQSYAQQQPQQSAYSQPQKQPQPAKQKTQPAAQAASVAAQPAPVAQQVRCTMHETQCPFLFRFTI